MASRAQMGTRSKVKHRYPWLRRAAGVVLLLFLILILSIILFRFVNPPITPVMVVEKLKGNTLRRDWVKLEDISPQLPLAVIASEDGYLAGQLQHAIDRARPFARAARRLPERPAPARADLAHGQRCRR